MKGLSQFGAAAVFSQHLARMPHHPFAVEVLSLEKTLYIWALTETRAGKGAGVRNSLSVMRLARALQGLHGTNRNKLHTRCWTNCLDSF